MLACVCLNPATLLVIIFRFIGAWNRRVNTSDVRPCPRSHGLPKNQREIPILAFEFFLTSLDNTAARLVIDSGALVRDSGTLTRMGSSPCRWGSRWYSEVRVRGPPSCCRSQWTKSNWRRCWTSTSAPSGADVVEQLAPKTTPSNNRSNTANHHVMTISHQVIWTNYIETVKQCYRFFERLQWINGCENFGANYRGS